VTAYASNPKVEYAALHLFVDLFGLGSRTGEMVIG